MEQFVQWQRSSQRSTSVGTSRKRYSGHISAGVHSWASTQQPHANGFDDQRALSGRPSKPETQQMRHERLENSQRLPGKNQTKPAPQIRNSVCHSLKKVWASACDLTSPLKLHVTKSRPLRGQECQCSCHSRGSSAPIAPNMIAGTQMNTRHCHRYELDPLPCMKQKSV
jgi:hypothetical protein